MGYSQCRLLLAFGITIDSSFSLSVMVAGETCTNGLGADGEVIEVLRILIKLIGGSYASQFSFHFNYSLSYIPERRGGALGAIVSIFLAALTVEARSLAGASSSASASLEILGSVVTRAITTLQRSSALREVTPPSWTPLFHSFAALSKATMFGDAVEACKLVGECTAKLKARLRGAMYVMDAGNLPPDPGAMCLVFFDQGPDGGVGTGDGGCLKLGGVGN